MPTLPEAPTSGGEELDDLRSTVITAGRWTIVDKWGGRIANLVTFGLLAHLLTPRSFGVVALALVLTSLLEVFVDQGVSVALVRIPALSDDIIDTAFAISLVLSAVMAIACFALAPVLASGFHEPDLAQVTRLLSVGVLFNGLSSVPEALLQRDFAFRSLAIRRMLATTLGGVLAVALAFGGAGAEALAAQYVLAALIGMLVLWRAVARVPKLRIVREHARELLSFGLRVAGLDLLAFAGIHADDFLIGVFLGPVALGYYVVAFRILLLLTEVLTATIGDLALPTFARMQHDRVRLINAYVTSVRISVASAVPVFALLGACVSGLIPTVFGSEWAASVPVARLLAIVGIVHAISYFDRPLLIALAHPGVELMKEAAAVVCDITGFALAAPHGITWVALVLVIRNVVFQPIRMAVLRTTAGIPPKTALGAMVPGLVASAFGAGVSAVIVVGRADNPVAIAIAVAGGAGMAILTLRLFFRSVFRELVTLFLTLVGVRARPAPAA